jgi:hypothetical protein
VTEKQLNFSSIKETKRKFYSGRDQNCPVEDRPDLLHPLTIPALLCFVLFHFVLFLARAAHADNLAKKKKTV